MSGLADILMGRNVLAGDPGPDEVYGTEDIVRMMNANRMAKEREPYEALSRLLMTLGSFGGSAPVGALGANTFRRSPDLPSVWQNAHPRTTVDTRLANERIANSAIRIGDEMFVAPTHLQAIEAAAGKLGPNAWSHFSNPGAAGVDDGFVTTAGRYLDRWEANALARSAGDPAARRFRPFMDSTDLPHVGPFAAGVIR